jgi:outer membrane lipoprotein LolB
MKNDPGLFSGFVGKHPGSLRKINPGRLAGAFLLVMVLLLAGCASQPTVPGSDVGWDDRRNTLAGTSDWRANGRIAVKSGGDGGQASIRWRQTGSASNVTLSGPFGVGAYEISWNDQSVEVRGKAGDVELAYTGPGAAEQFLNEQLGWSFPAMSLRYWILGVPDPAFESQEQFDTQGWLAAIRQNGWTIDYEDFEIRDDTWLPRRIVMNSDKARVRLIVDDWAL